MRKNRLGNIAIVLVLSAFMKANAQTDPTLEELGNMIDDAIFFTDRYITPATDAIAYQAAAGWVSTPKKADRWDVSIGLNFNTFFVPQQERSFVLRNDQLKFFAINEATYADTPTALGNRSAVMLSGSLNGEPVTLESPEGVNRETIFYPYLQGAVGIGFGTEVVARFAPKIVLKHVDFQIYGMGLKHSLSRYFPKMEAARWFLSAMALYSKEDITVEFLDVETAYGNLGLNGLNSNVDSWQFQFSGSKQFGKVEIAASVIGNSSAFEYTVKGKKGEIEEVIPLHDVLNKELDSVDKTKFNVLGEVSGRYGFTKRLFLQGFAAFGKFLNTNVSLQYQF